MVSLGHIILLIRPLGLLLSVAHKFYPLLILRCSRYGRRRRKFYMHSDTCMVPKNNKYSKCMCITQLKCECFFLNNSFDICDPRVAIAKPIFLAQSTGILRQDPEISILFCWIFVWRSPSNIHKFGIRKMQYYRSGDGAKSSMNRVCLFIPIAYGDNPEMSRESFPFILPWELIR